MKNWSTLKKLIWLYRVVAAGAKHVWETITGTSPLVLPASVQQPIHSLTQYGKCVQNGTPTPSAPVDIVCNNGAIKVSPNLANMVSDNIVVGQYINNSGVETADVANFFYAPYVPVTPGGTYTMATSSSIWYFSVMQYDSSKNFLRRAIWGATNTPVGTEKTFGVGADCAYIRFGSNMRKATISLADVLAVDWMLTQTATAQDFRPYGKIYTDGEGEVLTVSGQNLVDLTAVTDGYYYDPTGVLVEASVARLTDYIPVRAGQKYTVYVKAARVGTAANVRCNLFNSAREWLAQSAFVVNSGAEAVSTVTPTENGYLRVSANFTGTGARVDWSTLQIVRGEYTLATMPPYEPYHAPQTVGWKNLFDASSYTEINAYVNANTGVLTTGSPGSMTQYCAVIPCKPNTQYNITGQGTSAWGAFPSDSIGTTATTFTKGGNLTTGANDRYLIGLVRANGDSIDYRNTLVVRETVSDIPMLLSVGDVKDKLEFIGGHADIAITVFRVSPDLNWALASSTGYKQFYAPYTRVPLKSSVSCMSNIAPYGCSAANRASYQHGCYTGGTGNLCFQMIGEADINTVDDWKDFLSTNGVYVVAVKATETTEQTTPHSLHSYAGTTIVDAQTNVDPVTLSVEYAKTA